LRLITARRPGAIGMFLALAQEKSPHPARFSIEAVGLVYRTL